AERTHRIGLGHFYHGEDEKALVAFRESIRLEPKQHRHHFMLGVVLKYSDMAAAETAMAEAARLAPTDPGCMFELGRIRARLRKWPEALAAYEKVCELDPKRARAHFDAGNVLSEMGRLEESLKHYLKTVELDSRAVDAYYNAGQTLYLLKRFEAAYRMWLKVAEFTPDDMQIHKKLVQACYGMGAFDKSGPHRKKLFDLRNSTPRTRKEIQEYCFDQFEAGDDRVFAYETFDKTGDLYYHYTFKVVSPDGEIQRTVNIESSAVARELGALFMLGEDEKGVHRTYHGFKKLPPYPELKKEILKVIERKLEPGASSRKGG
ncbi:MAG: tetratricopeptide repeat protein, partial [Planctomycetota bacterium]